MRSGFNSSRWHSSLRRWHPTDKSYTMFLVSDDAHLATVFSMSLSNGVLYVTAKPRSTLFQKTFQQTLREVQLPRVLTGVLLASRV